MLRLYLQVLTCNILWSFTYRSAGRKFQYEGEEHTIEETSESRLVLCSHHIVLLNISGYHVTFTGWQLNQHPAGLQTNIAA